ncbi:hypothetical protein [Nocardioides okcheonensis]|uniref:hypothetical protein n=1 Tax=Nocardioides okcheonensis TaxID=2894081 RepID=UPI001E649E06|nr:hypothetical protein [Nocardioides okcheonensis]UFN45597.1 hypothetical protein LN652_05140 [Nocardioides okcheonensis]
MSEAGDAPEVGSLGEEAVRLLGALSGWARDHADDAGDGLAGLAAQAAASARDLDDHLATGAAECTVCPICRTVHAVRQLGPEVTGHLAAAVTSLAHAANALLATHDAGRGAARRQPDGRGDVEHVDLDDPDLSDDWPGDE